MNLNLKRAPAELAPCKTEVWPVIHYVNIATALVNVDIAVKCGCDGVFLIRMDGTSHSTELLGAAKAIRSRFPDIKIGINWLELYPASALELNVKLEVDVTWLDNCGATSEGLDGRGIELQMMHRNTPNHRVFAGVAFKYQKPEPNPPLAARIVLQKNWIPTTSGTTTGSAPDLEKIKSLFEAVGRENLAVASGITPDNISVFLPYVSKFLVATGISRTFYDFDLNLLSALMLEVKKFNEHSP